MLTAQYEDLILLHPVESEPRVMLLTYSVPPCSPRELGKIPNLENTPVRESTPSSGVSARRLGSSAGLSLVSTRRGEVSAEGITPVLSLAMRCAVNSLHLFISGRRSVAGKSRRVTLATFSPVAARDQSWSSVDEELRPSRRANLRGYCSMINLVYFSRASGPLCRLMENSMMTMGTWEGSNAWATVLTMGILGSSTGDISSRRARTRLAQLSQFRFSISCGHISSKPLLINSFMEARHAADGPMVNFP